MAYQLDVSAIVTLFGGAAKLSAALSEADLTPVKPVGIMRWIERNSIRSDRVADLMKLAARRGIDFDVAQFVIETEAETNA